MLSFLRVVLNFYSILSALLIFLIGLFLSLKVVTVKRCKFSEKKGLNVYLIIKLFPESYKSVENEDDELGIRLLLYNSTHA